MQVVLVVMFGITFLVVFLSIFVLIRYKNTPRQGAPYAVFDVRGSQLIVLAGIPVTYNIADIEQVTFSPMQSALS